MIELAGGQLYHGDCLEVMDDIPDGSIDMILADLPYKKTQNHWDQEIIPFEPLWKHYERVIKQNGSIVLTADQPFTSLLICSNLKAFCYQDVWVKTQAVGHLNAYKMPMRQHEDIVVFSPDGKLPPYNPLITKKPVENIRPLTPRTKQSGCYGKHGLSRDSRRIPNDMTLPTSVKFFANAQNTIHPTQKPVALFEYLIKTYTNEDDTVLDNVIGSGTTAVASFRTGRRWIGIEKDDKIFEDCHKRIVKDTRQQMLFTA